MGWIDNRIAEYYQWLKDNTAIREDKGTGWFSVSTPFVGLFNDNIEIFVKKESETKILLSDDGETIENLFLSGVDVLRSQKRKDYMQKVANNFGIKITPEGEIVTESNGADFARKKHNIISAISSISDMSMLSNDKVTSIFAEDVVSYVERLDVYSNPPFNVLRQNGIERFLFCMGDIKEAREKATGKDLKSLAIINDTIEPPKNLINALEEYGTPTLLWSKREEEESKNLFKIA